MQFETPGILQESVGEKEEGSYSLFLMSLMSMQAFIEPSPMLPTFLSQVNSSLLMPVLAGSESISKSL